MRDKCSISIKNYATKTNLTQLLRTVPLKLYRGVHYIRQVMVVRELDNVTGKRVKEKKLSIRPNVELYFDEKSGSYSLVNHDVFHDVILMPCSALSHIQIEFLKTFGTSGAVMLQKIGEVAGAQSAKGVLNNADKEVELQKIFSSISKWGFGKYELLAFDPAKYIRIRLKNNLKMAVDENSVLYKHHYLIGFYKAYFSTVFGKNFSCEERLCVNLNYKYCEFELSPA